MNTKDTKPLQFAENAAGGRVDGARNVSETLVVNGGQGRNRTADTRIFSHAEVEPSDIQQTEPRGKPCDHSSGDAAGSVAVAGELSTEPLQTPRPIIKPEALPTITAALVGQPFSQPAIVPGEPGAASAFALHRQVRKLRRSRERDADYQRLILRSAALLAEALIVMESTPSLEQKQRTAGGIRAHFRNHATLFRDLARAGVEVHPLLAQLLPFFGGDEDER